MCRSGTIAAPPHFVRRQARAAASLVSNIREAIGDDDDAKLDMIEGETSLKEILEACAQRLAVLDANVEAINKLDGSC